MVCVWGAFGSRGGRFTGLHGLEASSLPTAAKGVRVKGGGCPMEPYGIPGPVCEAHARTGRQ